MATSERSSAPFLSFPNCSSLLNAQVHFTTQPLVMRGEMRKRIGGLAGVNEVIHFSPFHSRRRLRLKTMNTASEYGSIPEASFPPLCFHSATFLLSRRLVHLFPLYDQTRFHYQ